MHDNQVLQLKRGETMVIETPGGGGHGDPLKRPPQRVLDKVLDRKVSP